MGEAAPGKTLEVTHIEQLKLADMSSMRHPTPRPLGLGNRQSSEASLPPPLADEVPRDPRRGVDALNRPGSSEASGMTPQGSPGTITHGHKGRPGDLGYSGPAVGRRGGAQGHHVAGVNTASEHQPRTEKP